jgi:DNA gyrase/topoisomerase IV subunit A
MERQRSAEAADRIVELEEHLSVSRQTLAAMADEATELRAQLDDHVRNRAEQSDAIDTLADDLSHANKTLFELTSALRLKETEAARDHQTLSDDLLQANKTLFELTSALRLKEAAAARDHQELQDLRTQRSTLNSIVDDNTWRLNRLQNELNGVKSTFFWRLAAPFRSFQRRVQLTNEYKLISRSGLFDPAWYLDKYPDVKTTNIDPLFHYLRYGANEGRRPSPLFDTTVYLQRNPDIKAAGLNPLVHYLRYGLKEARPLSAKDETL